MLALSGCSTKRYRKSADQEVYHIIAEKGRKLPNMEKQFTIETNALVSLAELPAVTSKDESLGPAGQEEVDAKVLSLERALEIAVKNSRTYQNQKEILYLQALSLTLDRHRFTPIFSGGARSDYHRTTRDVHNGIDTIVEEEHSVTGSGRFGFSMLLRSGGRIAADFTSDFLRYLTGDPRVATSSALAATLSQPLLRGAGYRAATENLTQAERNLLYALRNFVQFRREFVVQIAAAYYGVLQNRDTVRNEWFRYQSFQKSAERERAFAEEGLRKKAELGRIEQEGLSTEISLNNAIRAYKQSLDQFKILIGLPTDTRVVLDEKELALLGIHHPAMTLEEAVRIALTSRLDLYTVRDQYEDAARKIDLAANGLKPDLDVIISANVGSKPGSGLPELDFERARWNAGLDLNLPLDRKAERNIYRASLIAHQRAARGLELAVDNIKLEVYDDWRRLDQARRNYQSSELGVELSQRRVEEQKLLAALGRGTAKDEVDAQNDLTRSLNQRTSALVSHTINRLTLWRDMGVLTVRDDGKWEETTKNP